MFRYRTSADRRDDLAADRDEAAERRDDIADGRDQTADQRDAEAAERDADARCDSDVVDDRVRRLYRQILHHLEHMEDGVLDPVDLPGLTPAALDRLAAHTAEQRRLAGLDKEVVSTLFDELRDELGQIREDRHAAARDRDAAARDRRRSAGNRHDSGVDRDDSARDRGQAAIEREQTEPRDRAESGQLRPLRPAQVPPPTQERTGPSADRASAPET